jgi:uncharacterized protein YhjY with autotransporter beta-barrel domain
MLGANNSKEGEMNRQLVVTLLVVFLFNSSLTWAAQQDDDFEDLLFDLCVNFGVLATPGSGWDGNSLIRLNDLCLNVLQGGATPSSDYNSSSNIGSSGATGKTASNTAQVQVDSVKDRLAEIQEEEVVEQGSWGFLLSAQTSETEREETVNESGYESDLNGVLIGGDYRFNDRLITGAALGFTTDKAEFDNNTGDLDTTNTTLVGYFTFLPSKNIYIDGYFGVAKLDFESDREIDFQGTPTMPVSYKGTATGDYEGDQTMAGLSAGYDWKPGNFSIGAFVAFDISDTDIDAYDEDGGANPTGFEFNYDDQEIKSELSSVGINASYDIHRGWGVLVPTFSVSSVHQSADDTRNFALQPSLVPLSSTIPTDQTTLLTETDEPDRDYVLTSVGLIAVLKNGAQIFVTYEEMSSHDFIESWTLSTGVLVEVF